MEHFKLLREKLAAFLFSSGQYRAGCAARGKHLGEAAGRCLACGRLARKLSLSERIIIETAHERNSRIRRQARQYGL